jgi:hypothetical protein
MDEMSRVSHFYITRNKSRSSIISTIHSVTKWDELKWAARTK